MKKRDKQNTSGSSKKSSIGSRNRRRGQSYELKLVKELKAITGNENLCTSRSESKRLDDMKIDIADPDHVLNFYVQAKATQAIPQVKKLNDEVGLTDRPLVIFWSAQEARESKQVSVGEYCIMPKAFFYELIQAQYKVD